MDERLLICFLVFFSCQAPVSIPYDLVISGVNLIDGTGSAMQPGMNIYVRDGRISKIDGNQIDEGEHVIDGTGKYVIPGLFDCHVHSSDYVRDFPRFIHFGVTSIFVTGGSTCTNTYFSQMRAMGESDSMAAPRVFHTSQHFTMQGSHPVRTYPSDHWVDGETVHYLNDTMEIERLVKEVTRFPIKGIKLTIEDGPMPPPVERMPQEFVNKVVKEADKNGTKVFVHVSDNKELSMALEAGVQNILHFVGVDLDFERDRKLTESIYEGEFSWVTTLMLDKSFIYPLFPEWIELHKIKEIYPEQIIGISNPEGIKRAEELMDFFRNDYGFENPTLEDIISYQVEDIKTLYENGVNMVLGTDTGNEFIFPGLSLHEEMQLMELGGMQQLDIIKMATSNAARMLDVLDILGSIEVGKVADMVLLNRNPLEKIEHTLAIEAVLKEGIIKERIGASSTH